MAEGETATPILRPGVVSANVIPQAPPPGVPVVSPRQPVGGYDATQVIQGIYNASPNRGAMPPNMQMDAPPGRVDPYQQQQQQQQQQGHNGMSNSGPFDGSVPNESSMRQISLSSPPPVPTNMRNAEFY